MNVTKLEKYKDRKILKSLYKKGFSIRQIAKRFKVSHPTILYWFTKYGIWYKCRRKQDKLSKNQLVDLYWKKKLSMPQIAKLLNLPYSSIYFRFIKYRIPRRTRSEINQIMWKNIGEKISKKLTKHPKISFSNIFIEKAYMVGLRAGDISAQRRSNYRIRLSTGSTHLAQIKMFKNTFSKYGHINLYKIKNNLVGEEWFISCDVDNSFSFLLKKPEKTLKLFSNKKGFFAFLAGFMDSEGSWYIKKRNKNSVALEFRLTNTNKRILKYIEKKLKKFGFHPYIYCRHLKGNKSSTGIFYRKNIYSLVILRNKEVIKLAKLLLPLSKHDEKIQKMKLIVKVTNMNKWNKIKKYVANLRKMVKKI